MLLEWNDLYNGEFLKCYSGKCVMFAVLHKAVIERAFLLRGREYVVQSYGCSVYGLATCLESSLCQPYKIGAQLHLHDQ
jgi:hypothetical protein